jgi:type II secretory pathway pseudopilin PulG
LYKLMVMRFSAASSRTNAFTLLELGVVIGIIAILASLLLPVLSRTKSRAKRLVCIQNLRQVDLAVRMYADAHQDTLPQTNSAALFYVFLVGFTNLAVESNGLPVITVPPERTVLVCPADRWALGTEQPWERGSGESAGAWKNTPTYLFNGGNSGASISADLRIPPETRPGIAGRRLGAIVDPSRTVLVAERTAFGGASSIHDPSKTRGESNNMRNVVGFVDGHVSYVKIYHNSSLGPSCAYDPIAGYDYKWSGQ